MAGACSGTRRRRDGAISAANVRLRAFPQGEFISPEEVEFVGSPTGESRVGRHDHAMDEIRYFAATVVGRKAGRSGVFAGAVRRGQF